MPRIQDMVQLRPRAVGEPTRARRQLCRVYPNAPIIVDPRDVALVVGDPDLLLDAQALHCRRRAAQNSGPSMPTESALLCQPRSVR